MSMPNIKQPEQARGDLGNQLEPLYRPMGWILPPSNFNQLAAAKVNDKSASIQAESTT